MKLVEAVLEYIQGMSVVKAYGLDKDSGQAVQKTVDESCEKALGLEHSVAPWMGLRQITVRVFAVALAVCALVLYSGREPASDPVPADACCLFHALRGAGERRQYGRQSTDAGRLYG